MTVTVRAGMLAVLAGTACAIGAPPVVIFSEIVASPTSEVPGVAGARFTAFDRPYASPDGKRWVIGALTDRPAAENEVIIAGVGPTRTLIAREGTALVPGETFGEFDRNLGISNSGDVLFANNTNGPTASDEVVVIFRASGGTFDVTSREGQLAPGSLGAGVAYGTSIFLGSLGEDGKVFQAAISLSLLPTTSNSVIFLGDAPVTQEGVTVPTGQVGGATATWEFFDFEDAYASADGRSYLLSGDLGGPTTVDDVVTVDNAVVLQEGSIVPGSSFTSPIVSGFSREALMMRSGDWFVRGSNADGIDWVVRSGRVVAVTDQPVPGGLPGETWDDSIFATTFFSMLSNAKGEMVIGGVTNNSDISRNAVLVFNTRVVAREGDGVDVNGNGIADDDAFISVFNNDDAFLTEDGVLFFTADLRNGTGTAIGQAFMTFDTTSPPPPACAANCNGDTGPTGRPLLDIQDFTCFQNAFALGDLARADVGSPTSCAADGILDIADFSCFQNLFALGCP